MGIILARLLMPDKFGLIGMLAIFMGLATTFIDSGFGAALIQRKNLTQLDCDSIFYFNIVVGVVSIGPFGAIQNALLCKKMDFRTQTIVSVSSGLVSGVTGVVLAMRG
jgi:hypothetical protein